MRVFKYHQNNMSNQEIQDKITEFNLGVVFSEEPAQYLTLTVPKENLHFLMNKLKGDIDLAFDFLFCLTGVDWGAELVVVYHLESTLQRHILVVKAMTADRENPTLDSVQDIWQTANFHEMEVFDFFGIKFNNHPNLKRLFLPKDWTGYPLRKDYDDPINMIIK